MTTEQAQKIVDDFNRTFSPGDELMWRMDNSANYTHVVLKAQAFVLSGHTPVAFFQGMRGCVSIEPQFIKP